MSPAATTHSTSSPAQAPPTAQPTSNGKPITNGEPNGQTTLQFDTIPDAIEAFRANEFILVLDSPSRENEGDLIIAAEAVTPAQLAFMIHHTSGLICAPLPPSLCDTLALPPMIPPAQNEDPKGTAYTVSVDAHSDLLSTGISAHDRALTCRTLAAMGTSAGDLRRPGHVFPLRAREGGVRERRGHTEAAVEFCRLAGKREVGVIAELVDDVEGVEGRSERSIGKGGGMMRAEGCLRFGRRWGIRVVTIEALVEYLDREEGKGVNGREDGA